MSARALPYSMLRLRTPVFCNEGADSDEVIGDILYARAPQVKQNASHRDLPAHRSALIGLRCFSLHRRTGQLRMIVLIKRASGALAGAALQGARL